MMSILLCLTVVCSLGIESKAKAYVTTDKEDAKAKVIILESDVEEINLGSFVKGSPVMYKPVVITNTCDEEAELIWTVADTQGLIRVDAPEKLSLAPGEKTTFYLGVASEADAGSYRAVFAVTDIEDTAFANGTDISISYTIGEGKGTVNGITVIPSDVSMVTGSEMDFDVIVTSTGNPNNTVSWSVEGSEATTTSIDANGLLVVGADETASSLKIIATSNIDESLVGESKVELQSAGYTVAVKAVPSVGGMVYGNKVVGDGGYANLYAAPMEGYSFEGWYVNDTKVSDSKMFVQDSLKSDMLFTARFSKGESIITTTSNHDAAGIVSGGGTFEFGESCMIKAQAMDGYRFTGWYNGSNLVGTEAEMEVEAISEDMNLIGCFEPEEFLVRAYSDIEKADITVADTINCEASFGYRFAGWYSNGALLGEDTELIVDKNQDICLLARFEDKRFKRYSVVVGDNTTGGYVTLAGENKVQSGQSFYCLVLPEAGYEISEVYVDDEPVGAVNRVSFAIVTKNHKISAEFKKSEEVSVSEEAVNIPASSVRTFINEMQYEATAEQSDLVNFFNSVLTDADDAVEIAGGNVDLIATIFDSSSLTSTGDKKAMDAFVEKNITVGSYFDILILKSINGKVSKIEEAKAPVTLTVAIPDELKQPGREFCVVRAVRNADDSLALTILKDEDDNPESITFSTDRFETFAIAYMSDATASDFSKSIIVVLMILIVLLALLVVNVILLTRDRKRI